MKKIIASNSRALRSALCTLLLGITALGAMPRSADANPILYAVFSSYSIGKYNATTGAVIQSGFITPTSPKAMAFSGKIKNLGNTIFVLQNGTSSTPTVSQYSMTGAVIKLNFITGLYYDTGIAVVGNHLFVAYYNTSGYPHNIPTVAEYNAATGALINAKLIALDDPTSGNGNSGGALTASGNSLFFAYTDGSNGPAICEYNVTTRAITPRFIALGPLATYLPSALTVSNNRLFVGHYVPSGGGTVGEYDATTGGAINATLITGLPYGPGGLAVLVNHLLVAEAAGVSEYNATTGAVINANFINFGNIGASQLVVRGK
jgi:hypothetical protein